MGQNDAELVAKIAARVNEITGLVIAASGRETGWVYLRSTVPADTFDIPRWHFDGNYYSVKDLEEIQCKFVLALVGPSTLFYPIPCEQRLVVRKRTRDRLYMQEYCQADKIIAPNRGEGAFFLGSQINWSALHSEPPLHEKRLFMSIVPCETQHIDDLKQRVLGVYPKGNYAITFSNELGG